MFDNIARPELTPCRPRLAPGGDCQGGLWRSIDEGKKAAQGGPLAFSELTAAFRPETRNLPAGKFPPPAPGPEGRLQAKNQSRRNRSEGALGVR